MPVLSDDLLRPVRCFQPSAHHRLLAREDAGRAQGFRLARDRLGTGNVRPSRDRPERALGLASTVTASSRVAPISTAIIV